MYGVLENVYLWEKVFYTMIEGRECIPPYCRVKWKEYLYIQMRKKLFLILGDAVWTGDLIGFTGEESVAAVWR
ncbi:hypothetical protein D7V83_12575 [bacterium 0.1xD8-71]|nr:hypothetical protein D7V83_12575 [bacterium 0.1xD8-71]